jgi:hypothetical protein
MMHVILPPVYVRKDWKGTFVINVLFAIVLAKDRLEYHISTYDAPGDNMFIISIRRKVWSYKTSLSPPLFIEVTVPI